MRLLLCGSVQFLHDMYSVITAPPAETAGGAVYNH